MPLTAGYLRLAVRIPSGEPCRNLAVATVPSRIAVPPPTPRLPTWIRWVDEDLWRDIHDGLVVRYHIFLGWNAVLETADDGTRAPSTFYGWVIRNYLESLAVALRRVTDDTKDSRPVSFVRLLRDIEHNSHELTHDWFVSRSDPSDTPLAEKRFRDLSVEGTDHLDPSIAARDRKVVVASVAEVKTYVDTYLAHLDSQRAPTGPTVAQAHAAVAAIYRAYRDWHLILTGVEIGPLISIPWEHMFTRAWLTNEQAIEIARQTADEWDRLI